MKKYVLANEKETPKTFQYWWQTAEYLISEKLWGQAEVVLSNGEYIVVEKAEK